MELKTLECPHCGANTTNTQNCDYCGSLLVRFVDKGIDITNTPYANGDNVYPGLLAELRKNLQLQLENPNEYTCMTDIFMPRNDGGYNSISIGRSKSFCWADRTIIELGSSRNGLIILLNFDTYQNQNQAFLEYNKELDKLLSKFKKLKSFELFTSHVCSYKDMDGCSRCGREYAIDFGNDAEGASILISEILSQVYGITQSDSIDIFTNIGRNKVVQARNAWTAAHGCANNSGCAGMVALLLISTLASIYSIYSIYSMFA